VKHHKNACGCGIGHIGHGGRVEVAAIFGLFGPERRRGDGTLRTDTVEVDDGTHTAVCPLPHA